MNIKVANVSLGGPAGRLDSCPFSVDAEHAAICNSTAAGVTYAVAAGNSGLAFDAPAAAVAPAAYPEVLTVTAMSDSDGAPGAAAAPPSCRVGESDDRYAGFSNFAITGSGAAHAIAGPGVCIRSTRLGGGYNTISGTSMATPHVAGAIALCLGEAGGTGPCTGLTPAQIVQKLRTEAEGHITNTTYGFSGDPARPLAGRYYGYLQWTPPAPPQPAPERRTSGNFDGDAKTDMAVWRPSNGTWYVRTSTTNLRLPRPPVGPRRRHPHQRRLMPSVLVAVSHASACETATRRRTTPSSGVRTTHDGGRKPAGRARRHLRAPVSSAATKRRQLIRFGSASAASTCHKWPSPCWVCSSSPASTAPG